MSVTRAVWNAWCVSALVVVGLVGVASTAAAQSVPVTVEVVEIAADGADVGVEGADVSLHIVIPPHQLEGTLRGVTDGSGRARFDVVPRPGAEVYAEVNRGGRTFSDPVSLDTPGDKRVRLRVMRTTQDPSVLFAATMQTIVEPWEDYVVFSQVWTLGVDQEIRFASSTEDMGSIVRIPLPEGAAGVTVVHPEDRARVMDGYIALGTEVTPAGLDGASQRPHLIVRFSLPTEGSRSLRWEQEMPMDVERASLVVPQVSTHAKHPTLNVRLNVLMCDEQGQSPDAAMMCFREISDRAEGTLLRDDMEVLVARGRAERGQIMRVHSRGWPAPYPWDRIAAIVLSLLAVGVGSFLYRRELRRRRSGVTEAGLALAALRAQREQLFATAGELEEQLARGEVLQRDYDLARARLREQLGVVLRRLRELEGDEVRQSEDA